MKVLVKSMIHWPCGLGMLVGIVVLNLSLVWATPDEQPGQRFEILADDLPAPRATPIGANPANIIERTEQAAMRLPEGFEANIFAQGLSHPRWFAIAPNGDVFLTQTSSRFREVAEPNRVIVLRDADGDGVAESRSTFAQDFDQPLGIVFVEGAVLVADTKGVWRLPYSDGALIAETRERLTPQDALGVEVGSHYHRVITLDPGGEYMYVSVGSTANVIEDPIPHATVQRFRLDGSEQTTFARGLRNPVGAAIYPGTNDLYVVVNERDMYGDGLVPDYFTRVQEGDFYGWPYAYSGTNPDPEFGEKRPDLVATTKVPDVLFESHSAPVGLIFYDGEQFPEEYRGDAFITLHGSWNRTQATGYKIVRVHFENGRPSSWYENFATGFWTEGEKPPQVWGRPAGLAVMPDGSLLMADDWNDTIWRISYKVD